MSLETAEYAGFCFGVKRGVELVEGLLKEGKKVCTIGPLIHNPQVVESFARRGVVVAHSPSQVPKGYQVVIRSHGVPWGVLQVLELEGHRVSDATCPYVSKIHRLVAKASEQGKITLIAGDLNHPEVEGIVSHAQSGFQVFSEPDQLVEFLKSDSFSTLSEYILVAQTTYREEDWLKIKKFINNGYTNVKIFGTICNATMLRQNAAYQLATQSDRMIVIGGHNSSNTKKLTQICQKYCKTLQIEEPSELNLKDFSKGMDIGVTAGASTPAYIIKEVQRIMSDVVNNTEEMSFEEMLDQSFKTVSARDKVTAIVTSVAPNEIAVDIGTKHAGYVPLYEYTDDPDVDLMELVKEGDEIELLVLRLNDAEGTALLSKKRLDAIAGFEKIAEAEAADETLTGTVVDIVKGGIIALTHGVRVFIPASQASLHRGQDLEELRGQEVEYRILETNKNRRRAVGSIRAVLREEQNAQAEEFWETVEVGQMRQGIVKSLTSYGAFIDLGGVDGMAHISELSWSRIKHPSDVVSVGEEVEVLIKDVDKEAKKISLSYKKDTENPWKVLERDYKPGIVVTAKIVSMTSFGAFAQVIPGVDGLIHISQISHDRIEKPSDVLTIGQEVDVVITDIDFDRKRVSLSIRALLDEEARIKAEEDGDAGEEIVAQAAPPEETPVVEEVAEEVEEAAETVTEEVEEAAETVTEEVEEAAETVTEEVEEAAETVTEEVEEAAEEVEEATETLTE